MSSLLEVARGRVGLALAVLAVACGTAACSTVRAGPAAAPGPAAVETLARLLAEAYVAPTTGARYAAGLRANLASGAYDRLEDPRALAQRLTLDLQAIAPDGHLRVLLEADADRLRRPPPGPAGEAPREGPPRGPGRRPPASEDARWLAPGVAAIRLNEFPGTPENVAALDRFMADHASARAIILDARTHHGGGLEEMNVLLPYLYPVETTLVAMEVARGTRDPLAEDQGLRPVAGPPGLVRREHVVQPHPRERRLFEARVFYLTSRRTASAAEHLALAFKRTHRAVLVGERTAGGNHFGGFEPIGLGLAVFLPVGRTFDPDTGLDWEGVGVEPDVACAPAEALEVALALARKP